MKKNFLLVLVLCLLFTGSALGASLVCDPQANVTKYRVIGLDPTRTEVAAEADGSVLYDLTGLSPGPYNGTLEAGWPYILDGVPQAAINWSTPPVPFDLTVPDTPASSSGLGIE